MLEAFITGFFIYLFYFSATAFVIFPLLFLILSIFFMYFLFNAKTAKKSLLIKSIIAVLFIVASNSVFVFSEIKELQQIQTLLLYFILVSLFLLLLLLLFLLYILLKYGNKFWFIFIFSNLLFFAYSYFGIVFASGMCIDSCNVVPSFYEKVFAGLGGFVMSIMVIFVYTKILVSL